jgi:hypothetical protein
MGVNDVRRVRLTTSPPSVNRLSRKTWELRRLTTLWASTACYKDIFSFFFTMRQLNPIYTLTSDFTKALFSIVLSSMLRSRKLSLQILRIKYYTNFTSLTCVLSCPHHIVFHLIRVIFSYTYELQSSSLHKYLGIPVTTSLLGPNILLNILLLNVLSLCTGLKVTDQATQNKIKTTML